MPDVTIATVAKRIGLPLGSATAFVAWAQDAGNWGGQPYTQNNVDFGRSTSGYVKKLVAAGLVETHEGEQGTYLSFTPLGIQAAAEFGVDLSYLAADDIDLSELTTTIDDAPKPKPTRKPKPAPADAPVCKKVAAHGSEFMSTTEKSGTWCRACDKIAVAARAEARAAAGLVWSTEAQALVPVAPQPVTA